MKLKIKMTLSIGYAVGRREATLEIDDAPDDLSEDDLISWLHEAYWDDWASGYIDGGVSIVERNGEAAK
jgi:hypothetical protein